MAGRPFIPAVGPSYPVADRKASSQRSINLRVRIIEASGEAHMMVLDAVEGLVPWVTFPASIRGIYQTDRGKLFVVAGATLYEVASDGTKTVRGSLITSTGYVSMRNGLFQLIIVDGANGYVFTFDTNGFAQITDPDWRGSQWVEELNGQFIFVPSDSPDQFYISAVDDGASYDALDFSSSDAQPDNIVTHRVMKQELFLFNARSTEVWIYTGENDFPLARYNSTPIDIGCVGLRAAVVTSDSMFWVGSTSLGTGIVYEMRGHSPVRVSQWAVEQAIKQTTDISELSMWCYQIDGAEFIGLNAPGMSTTWVYNLATQQWHEQGLLVAGVWTAWPAQQMAYGYATHYAVNDTQLMTLDNTVSTVDGEEMSFERTWPHLIAPAMEPVSYPAVEVSMSTGSPGDVTLEISNDGGSVWGPALRRTFGAAGRRMERLRWLGLGSAINRVFRLRWKTATPVTLYSASVEAT